jgi:hypothetical protein
MRITIYQPRYFPQLHYFNRILNSDVFVILDSAQYTKSLVHVTPNHRERHPSFQSDTPIKFAGGQYVLTVPVRHDGLKAINQTAVDYANTWPGKHAATIRTAYAKAGQFPCVFPSLETVIKRQYQTLADLNIASILWALSRLLDCTDSRTEPSLRSINRMVAKNRKFRLKKIIRDQLTGAFRPPGTSKGTEWTIAICQAMKATEYVYGGTAKEGYMDMEAYKKNGIRPIQQNWSCPRYPQLYTEKVGYLPNLSIIDLLMNVDAQTAISILT